MLDRTSGLTLRSLNSVSNRHLWWQPFLKDSLASTPGLNLAKLGVENSWEQTNDPAKLTRVPYIQAYRNAIS